MSSIMLTGSPRMARVAIRFQPRTCHRYISMSSTATHAEPPIAPEPMPSNWTTTATRPVSRQNLSDLFNNRIPDVRFRQFLTPCQCQKLVEIIQSHQIGSYDEHVFPPIGSVGTTQFGNKHDKAAYFSQVAEARVLQERFRKEANVDVIGLVRELLQRSTGLPVRIAQEDDQEYFAGLVRLIDRSALLHADYGPYDGPDWEIGKITAQITWNILLKQVEGGESIVYDRPWEGPSDDAKFKNTASYGYKLEAVQNRMSKSMKYEEGDLHFFNSRNFHEVKALPSTANGSRYTVSSFVGYLPNFWPNQPGLIMWS